MKTTSLNTAKLTTSHLIAINTVFLLVYMLYGIQSALQMIIILPTFAALLLISGLYHLLLWLFTRKKELKSALKILLYLLPVIVLALLSIIIPKTPELPNQQSRLVSDDKQYIMTMDMKHYRWTVSIYDGQGKKLYTDDSSGFLGQFNVYWIWDHNDRLWLYNSDDSIVYYWVKTPTGWKKGCWSSESDKNIHDFYPPKALYPKYK